MAALKLLHENTVAILTDARHAFAQSDLGESGETVAQLMCLLAVKTPSFIDDEQEGCRFGVPDSINCMNTPLHEFLSKFFDQHQRPQPASRRSPRLSGSALNDAVRAAVNAAEDASVDPDFKTRVLRYFDQECTEAVIRVTHFRRSDRLPSLVELPFLFDIGAALLLPRGNPGTDVVIIVRLCVGGEYFYSLVAIQVKNVIDSVTNAALLLLHDLMNVKTLLRPDPTDDAVDALVDDSLDNAASIAGAAGAAVSGASVAGAYVAGAYVAGAAGAAGAGAGAAAVGAPQHPILRVVMKTRMSMAESTYPDVCFLKLKCPDTRDQGTGIVRGFPRMLSAQVKSILNEMLRSFDRRTQMPERVCDPALMQPWFDSMHDSAGERQLELCRNPGSLKL
jgi:hypothetical protein